MWAANTKTAEAELLGPVAVHIMVSWALETKCGARGFNLCPAVFCFVLFLALVPSFFVAYQSSLWNGIICHVPLNFEST